MNPAFTDSRPTGSDDPSTGSDDPSTGSGDPSTPESLAARSPEQLRDYAQALEQTNRSLVQATVQAEAASRAKSRFLANMSHEIRTPLTAILGFVEVLREKLKDPETAQALDIIERNGEHLLVVLNDILDLSKIEAGQLRVERISYSPAGVLIDCHGLMEVRARDKSLALETVYRTRIPELCLGDPTRIRQVLLNLVGNALKFTETGGIRVEVSLIEDPEPRLRLDVCDSGPGIDEEQAAHLFEAFAQADSSTTRRFGGTGLGLTISRELARILGGDLQLVESTESGSRFRFEVPVGPIEGVSWIDPDFLGGAWKDETPSLRSGRKLTSRILLAEDGVDNQRLITHFLTKQGAVVVIAHNGREAVERMREARDKGEDFGLVLMDMHMPEIDGYEATRLLRQEGYRGPIIALTANAMVEDRQRCFEAGCDDFMSKPVRKRQFLALVESHLLPHPRSDELDSASETLDWEA